MIVHHVPLKDDCLPYSLFCTNVNRLLCDFKYVNLHLFIYFLTGNIKIDIPWTSLFSASVVAHLEDVYILAGPITDRVYDLEKERALQNAVKRQMLESLEASGITKAGRS